jgi:hypothetical protein
MSTYTEEELRLADQAIANKLTSGDPSQEKQAVDKINDFTRYRMREDGLARRILPLQPITDDELDRTGNSNDNLKWVDMEPDSPGAKSIPYAGTPETLYIQSDRYAVYFGRMTTRKFTKDVTTLRTNYIDIRTVLSDNSLKDLLDEEDRVFFEEVDRALVGPGAVCPTSGVVQHQEIYGGIDRDTLFESTTVLPSTPSSLEARLGVVNHITIKHIAKITRNGFGGDMAEEVMRKGWVYEELMGIPWLVTIKRHLVPNFTVYYFADAKFMGKFYELVPVTMYARREAWLMEFFHYQEIGGAIGNLNSMARVDFKV